MRTVMLTEGEAKQKLADELKRVQAEMDALHATYLSAIRDNTLGRYWEDMYELSGYKAGLRFARAALESIGEKVMAAKEATA